MGRHGVIAAGEIQTANAGLEMLHAGGNAVDAACAAAFASFVCEPTLASPAGGGIALFGSAEVGFRVLDFFTPTPGKGLEATPELDFFGVEVDFGPTTQVFHIGRGAAAVPSAIFGLLEMHRLRGTVPLREVVTPAVELAREGYQVSKAMQWVFELLTPILTLTPGVRQLYCVDGRLAAPGTTLNNPPLAEFFEALAEEGEPLLRGDFTEAVLADFGPGRGGMLTRTDLSSYRPVLREPLRVDFRGRQVLTSPPPSSGGPLISLGLALADRYDLGRHEFLGADHARAVASLLEVLSEVRRAGFDASIHQQGTIEALLSASSVDDWTARHAARVTERALGSTTHISVIDNAGGAASVTVSNGEGCGHVIGDYGIHMNNFLGEEDINPAGFHQFIPGTWMTTMMSPTVVLRDGRPELVLGSGGSNRIRSVVLQTLLNVLAFERPLQQAIDAPRMHLEGARLWFEQRGFDQLALSPGALDALRKGWPDHAAFDQPSMFFGGVHTAAQREGTLRGAGDQRRGGRVRLA